MPDTASTTHTPVEIGGAGQFEHDQWYYLKKKHRLFPGIEKPVHARFLADYYNGWVRNQGILRKAFNALTWAGFQLWVPFRARSVARKYSLSGEWTHRAKTIARKTMADPNDIALFRIEDEESILRHMRRYEHAGVNRAINPLNWEPGCRLGNKLAFHNCCLEHGIAHPRIYATADASGIKIYAVPQPGSLAFKPTGGEGGRGFAFLDFAPGGGDPRAEFATLIESEMKGRKGSWMVQQKLDPHPDLLPLSGSALLAARFTTMLNEQGKAEIVTSVLRFPAQPDAIVDNIKSGGMMAHIDIETGRLGQGCIGRGVGEVDIHPHSGVAIKGFPVPFVNESTDLACTVHKSHFSDYSLIGWDIALTADGPFLLEGNGKPCIIVAQRACRKGADETRFGELIAWHLSERAAGRDPLAKRQENLAEH